MNKDLVFGIVRHLLTTGAGVLVTDGYLNSSDATQLVGGLMVAVGLAWSVYNKFQHRKELTAAKAVPATK